MKPTKLLWLVAAIAMLAVPAAYAITTTTQVNFNIAAVVAYTLTLPGESAVLANLTGAPTTAIEFNSTNGTEFFINPRVVGGTVQSDGTPIFQFDNTGTVNLNLSVQFTTALPACVSVFGNTAFTNLSNVSGTIATANVTIVDNYGPATAAQDWYMQANFSGCAATDTTTRTLRSDGVQS